MSTPAPHPLPRFATVAREQLWTAGMAISQVAVAVGLMLAFLTYLVFFTPGSGTPFVLRPNMLAIPATILGIVTPQSLWRHEGPARRSYFFSLPVERFPHLLLKHAAGWVWAMAGTGLFYLWAMVAVRWTDITIADAAMWQWVAPFAAATFTYLVAASIVTAFDRSDLVIIGTLILAVVFASTRIVVVPQHGRYGLFALSGGIPGARVPTTLSDWLIASALWLGMGAAALYVAARVQRDV